MARNFIKHEQYKLCSCDYVLQCSLHYLLCNAFCADRPFLPNVVEHYVANWEQLRVKWQVRYNPVYNTSYTAWFYNRSVPGEVVLWH